MWPPRSRAKLLRFALSVHTGEREWKERGTGELKLLRHKTHNKVRLLMRQDKTLKICANHVVEPSQPLVRVCAIQSLAVCTGARVCMFGGVCVARCAHVPPPGGGGSCRVAAWLTCPVVCSHFGWAGTESAP